MLKNSTIFAGFILLLLSVPAEANNPNLEKILDLTLDQLMELEVTTPSKTKQKLSDAPGTIRVITRQQIHERGYINLLDLLQDLPEVDVNQKSVEEYFNQVAIRGVNGNNKFIIMQNGVRISSPTGEHIPISDNFPLFQAKQVEVAFGPVSSLYGADAFTGVINIITEKPEKFDGVEVGSHFGSDDYFYNYLNFSKPLTDNIDLSFGGHWNSSQNPDLSNAYPNRFQNVDVKDLNGNVVRSANRREPFTAATSSYSNYAELTFKKKFNLGMTQSFLKHPTTVGVNPIKTIFGDEAVWETKIETYHGKYKTNLSEQLSSETLLMYSRYQTLPDTKFTNTFADFSGFKYALGEKYKFDQQLIFILNKFHQFIGGVTYENYYAIPKTADLPSKYDTDKDAKEQNLFHIGTNNTLPIQIFDDEYDNAGIYLQAQSKWRDWISTTVGFRVDHDTRFGTTFNPRLGTTLKPRDTTIIKFQYGEAFLAPSPNNQFAFFGSFLGTQDGQGRFESNFFHLPNPDLKPEKIKTIEVSWTERLNPDLTLNSSFYYTRVDDLILDDTGPSNSEFVPGGIIASTGIFNNIGNGIYFGINLGADYKIKFDRSYLKLWGTYSWTDGRIEKLAGETTFLPNVSRHKIKSGLTFRYDKKYYITPRLLWIGRAASETRPLEEVSSYALLNLHLGVDNIVESLSAFMTITNLTDERFFNVGGGSNSFASSPQDPRRFFFGLKYKL